jgi:hypothetical protein
MNTKPASAFGLAMLAVAFSFSSSFACPETQQTTASVVESTVSESGMNVATLAEASAPEGQVGEVAATASVVSAPPTGPTFFWPVAHSARRAIPRRQVTASALTRSLLSIPKRTALLLRRP